MDSLTHPLTMDEYRAALAAAGLKEGPPLRAETVFRPRVGHKRDGDTLATDKHARIYYPTAAPAETLAALGDPPAVEVAPMPAPTKPPLTLEEKAERLGAREARWRALSPAAVRTMRAEGPWNADWDVLTGGMLYVTAGFMVGPEGVGRTPTHDMRRKDPEVPSFAVPLPSASNPDLRSPPLAAWRIMPPWGAYPGQRDGLDPTQNLLVSPSPMYVPRRAASLLTAGRSRPSMAPGMSR